MKTKDVVVGRVYAVKVSGTVQPVRLDSVNQPRTTRARSMFDHDRTQHGGWTGVNVKTSRTIYVRSAAKLRYEITKCPGCGVWIRVNGDVVMCSKCSAAHIAAHSGGAA